MISRFIIRVMFGVILVMGAILLLLGFFLLSARTALDTPNPLAIQIAETGKLFLVPPDASAQTNPVTSSQDVLQNAQKTYTARCVICHGQDGKGNTPIGSHIYPRAADLTAARTQSKSDGALHWIIANGIVHTGMPGWGQLLNDQEIWQVVTYVRQLPNGVPQFPTPTPPPTAANTSDTVKVDISNNTYVQGNITVAPGTTVVWQSHDDEDHTVTSASDPKVLDSPTLKKDQMYQFTFTQPGTYKYICTVHDYMEGTVVVK
ncbi:MAG TPA: c-type cytochrome [Anaerolineae bacterium]|nr:c-type cytochrome [Anaerolineae bacterium]